MQVATGGVWSAKQSALLLFETVLRYAPLIKDEAFRGEDEWRVISAPLREAELRFREGRHTLRPYVPLRLAPEGQWLGFDDVVVGSGQHTDLSVRATALLVQQIDAVGVRASRIPFRDW